MKRLLIILILTLSFQTLTKADDIRDFEIEGMSIGDSLFMACGNKNEVENPTANFQWEYILIDNKKMRNAWCMPGGKIAVYTGILDATKNTNGLAAVMGHEIAHAVANR